MSHAPDGFVTALERVLEHFADPEWIGTNSPLAAPYFLGEASAFDTMHAEGRGKGLQLLLREAATALDEDQRKLLVVSFFERNWNTNINGVAMNLDMSRAAYYRRRSVALEALARVVSARVSPALRGETVLPAALLGRESERHGALQVLRTGGGVTLLGNSGLGKSALGAAIAEAWNVARVFWYTVRPPLNDQLGSFVFALAHFLHGQGASQTWRQLVADQGEVKIAQILGLLRHDLALLGVSDAADKRVLLCVDEVDQLRLERTGHVQLIRLLEDVQTMCPLLLMGQQSWVQVQLAIRLEPLPDDVVRQLLTQLPEVNLPETALRQVLAIARGNPTLIRLFGVYVAISQNVSEAIAELRSATSMALLLARIWQYLNDDEQALLAAISVYRASAPRDVWQAQSILLNQLLARGLLLDDGRGGVQLAEQVREFVLQQIDAETRQALHVQAAQAYESRGGYTPAAYHYLQGRQAALAVWVWFSHRERETEQGRASAAREIFREVLPSDLSDDDDRRALALMRAEWLKLTGEAGAALTTLDGATWPDDHGGTGYAQRLRGTLHEMQGQIGQALQSFRAGLRALDAQPQSEATRLHVSIGYSHFRQREMAAARQAALNAQITAQEFSAYIEMQVGNYAQAQAQLAQALALAHSSPQTPRELQIRVYARLGSLAWQMGQPQQTIDYCNQAVQFLSEKGDSVAVLYQRVNLAAAYIMLGQHDRALAEVQLALPLAQSLQHAYLIAGLSVNAAEAHLNLGALDAAEQSAGQALQQEEDTTQSYAMTVLGMVQQRRGQLDKAEATLRLAAQAAEQIEDRYAQANALRELGRVLALRTDQAAAQAAAREAFDQAIALFVEMGLVEEADKTRKMLFDADKR